MTNVKSFQVAKHISPTPRVSLEKLSFSLRPSYEINVFILLGRFTWRWTFNKQHNKVRRASRRDLARQRGEGTCPIVGRGGKLRNKVLVIYWIGKYLYIDIINRWIVGTCNISLFKTLFRQSWPHTLSQLFLSIIFPSIFPTPMHRSPSPKMIGSKQQERERESSSQA